MADRLLWIMPGGGQVASVRDEHGLMTYGHLVVDASGAVRFVEGPALRRHEGREGMSAHEDYLRGQYAALYEACKDLPAILAAAAERARLDGRPESEAALGEASRKLAHALGHGPAPSSSTSRGERHG